MFVSDISTLRTFDPDRGLELFSDSASSDGRQGFRLVAPDGECKFDAFLSFRDATEEERRARPGIDRTAVYTLSNAHPPLPGLNHSETYEILREAVLARRLSTRDDEVNWAAIIPTSYPG
jgi:hypothetical protein